MLLAYMNRALASTKRSSVCSTSWRVAALIAPNSAARRVPTKAAAAVSPVPRDPVGPCRPASASVVTPKLANTCSRLPMMDRIATFNTDNKHDINYLQAHQVV